MQWTVSQAVSEASGENLHQSWLKFVSH
jgi:hypothetical protein